MSIRTRRAGRGRVLALALGVLLATVVLVLGRPLVRRPGSEVALTDQSVELQSTLLERQIAPRGLELPEPRVGALVREPMTVEQMGIVFPKSDAYVFDPICYYHYRPGLYTRMEWPEHPKGSWARRVNADGCREDHDLPPEREDLFLLATGDSHSEGACNNDETWSSRIEAELGRAYPGKRVEVYNTATASWSFYNYLGALEKFLPRRPDAFLVCFYGGNDFLEVTRPHAFFQKRTLPPRMHEYYLNLMSAKQLSETALSQCINQVLWFRSHPEMADLALDAALATTAEMGRLCRENQIPWIVAYLPPAFDLDLEEWNEMRAHALQALSLSEEDMALTGRLADHVLAQAEAAGATVIDLRKHLEPRGEKLYWHELHISLAGQERVVSAFMPLVEAALRDRP